MERRLPRGLRRVGRRPLRPRYKMIGVRSRELGDFKLGEYEFFIFYFLSPVYELRGVWRGPSSCPPVSGGIRKPCPP